MFATSILKFNRTPPTFAKINRVVEIPNVEPIDKLRKKIIEKVEKNKKGNTDKPTIHPSVIAAYQELVYEGYFAKANKPIPDFARIDSKFQYGGGVHFTKSEITELEQDLAKEEKEDEVLKKVAKKVVIDNDRDDALLLDD